MMDFDPKEWAIPIYVGVGLVISQLFMYGKKVKRRVTITGAEVIGDLMQVGVKLVVTIVSIKMMGAITKHPINDMWQIVATTIVICTSFDTYFMKFRDVILTRLLGAGAVLFGKIPPDSIVGLPAGEGMPPEVTVETIKVKGPLSDAAAKAVIPLKRALPVPPYSDEDEAFIREVDNPRP